ncbi:MAG TPA: DUF3224 domain-containing protein [Bacteroidota bacterium]|nr:DUF3224 domain-containing protein [Bacteroidota bacterium]
MKISATFMPKKWDEKTYEQVSPNTKLTRTVAEFQYTGQLQGEGLLDCLMFYSSFDEKDPHNATAEYVGLIRFKGNVNGRAGSFVLEDRGAFQAVTAKSSLRILPGSGTDQLEGISGIGTSVATPKTCNIELELRIP